MSNEDAYIFFIHIRFDPSIPLIYIEQKQPVDVQDLFWHATCIDSG
jgi:hypothetical protein